MKNFLFLFILFPGVLVAQNGLLWKVTSPNNKHTSYLFGTMHTNDSLLNTFDKNWWKAFNSCDVFAGEVSAMESTDMIEVFNAGMMKDTSLSDLYTEEELDRVRKFVLSKVEMPIAMMLMRMKPFYIMAAIMQLPEDSGPYTEVMDLRLQRVASEKGKKVIGLETSKEQSVSVGSMSLQEQAKMLLEFIDEGDKAIVDVKELEKFYILQQLDSMYDMSLKYEPFDMPQQMMEALVDLRNLRFLERLLPQIQSVSVFCAVGALHLPGHKGLINQLRKSGYVVEPVVFKFGEP